MEYYQPHSIEAAVKLAGPGSYYLAGGTDLVLQMREGRIKPQSLIDLRKISDLTQLSEREDYLEIGSMLTFAALGQSELIRHKAHALWLACQTMGSPQIRNQATLGGNLGNCSPAADGLPALLALGAEVRLVSPTGEELVDLAELLGRNPMLASGALIAGFRIPLRRWHSGFAKLGRRKALAIARLSIAVAVETEGNRAKQVRVALGAVGKRAFLSPSLSTVLENSEMNDDWLEAAASETQKVVAEALGARASAAYKSVAVGGIMQQAFLSLLGEGGISQ